MPNKVKAEFKDQTHKHGMLSALVTLPTASVGGEGFGSEAKTASHIARFSASAGSKTSTLTDRNSTMTQVMSS